MLIDKKVEKSVKSCETDYTKYKCIEWVLDAKAPYIPERIEYYNSIPEKV